MTEKLDKKMVKNMEEVLDIEASNTPEGGCAPRKKQLRDVNDDSKDDYEYTRGQLYTLIDQGQEAVRDALEVAQESGHPRAFEVATNAMKQVADMTDKLIDLQSKMKRLDEPTKGSTPTTVNNTMFLGSTADLQKMLKKVGADE
tara:strand:- start:472 stop:903 length:432 start_codon:yes stop_codon:yes gene_type:complete